MKILVTIAHYYKPSGGFYGSHRADPKPRIQALTRAIGALHRDFGPKQGLLFPPTRQLLPSSADVTGKLDIVVCTVGDDHLLAEIPAHLYRQHKTSAEPLYLAYEAHGVLKEALGHYDYYCYLEDDIYLSDPYFFAKLEWFNKIGGEKAVLQPNRYEASVTDKVHKLYIDCPLNKPEQGEKWQENLKRRPKLEGRFLDRKIVFQRVNNPHAGCFFLTEAQLRRWVKQPHFTDRLKDFGGPLESAATLGIMRTFDSYKPARENASFLEVEHLHHRYLWRYLEFLEDKPPFKFKVFIPPRDGG